MPESLVMTPVSLKLAVSSNWIATLYSTLLGWGVLAMVALAVPAWAKQDDNPHAWLVRMTDAARQLNYDGTFVYRNGTHMESMRIIHRVDESGERSRLVALSGVKREVLRDHAQVVCILPDDESVVVAKTRPPSPFYAAILTATEGFSDNYALSVSGGDRVAGRQTEVLMLAPRDEYRYGYNLWVDRETGLLLKSDLLSGDETPIEQFIYTSLSLPDEIADELLEPGITGQQLTWRISEASSDDGEGDSESSPWAVDWLPTGFMMADCSQSSASPGKHSVTQMVYTDGLASLSVFVEALAEDEPLEGLSAMGAMNAFGRVVSGFQVTVVGEVPAGTVEAVALSVRPN